MHDLIHRLADVQTTKIGPSTRIWQFVVVLENASIGKNCNINAHCFIENDVIIGNDVTIKCGCYLWDGLRVEDGVFIGPNVNFTNDKFPRSKQYPETFPSTLIRQGGFHRGRGSDTTGVDNRGKPHDWCRCGGDQGRTCKCYGYRQPGRNRRMRGGQA